MQNMARERVKRISIHALREESDSLGASEFSGSFISIHALREESDDLPEGAAPAQPDFYPRSP